MVSLPLLQFHFVRYCLSMLCYEYTFLFHHQQFHCSVCKIFNAVTCCANKRKRNTSQKLQSFKECTIKTLLIHKQQCCTFCNLLLNDKIMEIQHNANLLFLCFAYCRKMFKDEHSKEENICEHDLLFNFAGGYY